jgi:hypothetical protein
VARAERARGHARAARARALPARGGRALRALHAHARAARERGRRPPRAWPRVGARRAARRFACESDEPVGVVADIRALSRCSGVAVDDTARGARTRAAAASGRLAPCVEPLAWARARPAFARLERSTGRGVRSARAVALRDTASACRARAGADGGCERQGAALARARTGGLAARTRARAHRVGGGGGRLFRFGLGLLALAVSNLSAQADGPRPARADPFRAAARAG